MFLYLSFQPLQENTKFSPSAVPEDPDPEIGYPNSAGEILQVVIGGLSC